MNERILVTYATRAGSTGEVADNIGAVLRARGFKVDVRPIKTQPNVATYRAVVIGSAIRTGHWLPEAVSFVAANQKLLSQLPVALFSVHMNNTGSDANSVALRRAYLNAVRPLLPAVEEMFFTGKIDPSQLPLLDRLMVRAVKAPVGDFREWDKIRHWAQTVLA